MKNEIKIPSMGESISEVTIGQIIAPSGSVVKLDAEILELETDKVNQVLFAPQAGTVQLTVKSGDVVKIGQVIGSIEPGGAEESSKITSPLAEKPIEPKVTAAIPKPSVPKKETGSSGSLRVSQEAFIAGLKGTSMPKNEMRSTVEKKVKITEEKETRRPMTKIRKVIAQRLVEAQQTMAMLTTFNEIDLSKVIELRERYKETFMQKYQCKLGFMSFFVKAVVAALEEFPDLNSYIDGDEIVQRNSYDIGVAVGTERGVIVPVIRNCEEMTFGEIESSIEVFAKKAREGKITVDDLQGGGFTITNGGVYGSLLSTPILLPPQCGILGMHKIEKRAVVIDNQIVIRSMMYLALSYDHRLIDGKEAVSFLVHIKQTLEDPSRLLLEV